MGSYCECCGVMGCTVIWSSCCNLSLWCEHVNRAVSALWSMPSLLPPSPLLPLLLIIIGLPSQTRHWYPIYPPPPPPPTLAGQRHPTEDLTLRKLFSIHWKSPAITVITSFYFIVIHLWSLTRRHIHPQVLSLNLKILSLIPETGLSLPIYIPPEILPVCRRILYYFYLSPIRDRMSKWGKCDMLERLGAVLMTVSPTLILCGWEWFLCGCRMCESGCVPV
jgi:hypothetical protein